MIIDPKYYSAPGNARGRRGQVGPHGKKIMRILVACEFSGVVREAFCARGHDAWSCDLIDTEIPGPHFKASFQEVIIHGSHGWWDMLIAFPPCTYLARSGARWWKTRKKEQREALDFVRMLMSVPINKIAIENPIGIISTKIRKPDQIIQPWQFGHGETKATCLWLKNLPKLEPTNIVDGREPRIHYEPPSPDRWKNRSRTLTGIAQAMAHQWG
jgi:hypothetical protein